MNIWLIVLVAIIAILLVMHMTKRKNVSVPKSSVVPKQLKDGKETFSLPKGNTEKLSPSQAREWLDDFLQKQQK